MASPRTNSPVKAHYFFKIILSDIVSDSKMMIPKKFVRKYGKNLADRVFLKAPNGAFWQVELERKNSEVWLHNGWQEFTTYYSICFGHVLVFGYEGNSLFHVIILDTSASEIEYPMSDAHIEQAKLNVGKIDENAQAKFSTFQSTGVQHNRMNPIKLEEDLDSHGSMQELAKGKGVRGLRLPSEADKAIEAATKFLSKSKYPSFKSVMRPAYLLKGFLHLPTSLSTHMKSGIRKVRIEALDNSWEVRLVAGRLSAGWRRCVRDNSLQLDDVCVFELINKNDSVLKLSVFREKKNLFMMP